MTSNSLPKWVVTLEKKLPWIRALGVPKISILVVTLQALGFLMVMQDPLWIGRLALLPDAVLVSGEYWRLITFLALPISMSPIWVIFVLWFLYFVLESIEAEWDAFPTTLYVLISWLVTLTYSLVFKIPVLHAKTFESSLFLASAALIPELEVTLFFMIPVKMKWLAAFTVMLLFVEAFTANWIERGLMAAILSNWILFFGPAGLDKIKQWQRRRNYRKSMR